MKSLVQVLADARLDGIAAGRISDQPKTIQFSDEWIEEELDRQFFVVRINALRELAADGDAASAERLRWELAERRREQVDALRLDSECERESRLRNRPLSPGLRADLIRYHGRKCGICGTPDGPFEIDHRVPFSQGGASTPDNLWVLCKPCNRDKGTRSLEEYLEILEANKCLPS